MVNKQINPWFGMKNGTKRRVDLNTNHDYFWLVDFKGKYGFYLKFEMQKDIKSNVTLNGIDIVFKETDRNHKELIFVLADKENWEMFYILCFDLIGVIDSFETDSQKISKLFNRLEKWKSLLANKRKLSISFEQQMGLFTELFCLKNIIAKNIGYKKAIDSWVGTDKDKQDFSLESCVIEVKSHRTTKGNYAIISSKNQLTSEKEKFYIVSYGVTVCDNGKTIDDMFLEIVSATSSQDSDTLLRKLFEAGWILDTNGIRKYKFMIDAQVIYEVNEEFPKLDDSVIDSRIIDIKYKIDLARCNENIRTEEYIFGGE